MVDTPTLTDWLRELGDSAPEVVERGIQTWIVGVQRALSPEEISAWQAAPGSLEGAVEAVAAGLPLVRADLTRDGDRDVVRFWATVHGEGLSRQAFLLTASAVAKADRGLVVLTRANREYATAVDALGPVEEATSAPLTEPDRAAPRLDVVDEEPFDEKWAGNVDVLLTEIGQGRIQLLTALQSALGLDRAAALALADAVPTLIATGVARNRGDELVQRVSAAGGTARLQPSD